MIWLYITFSNGIFQFFVLLQLLALAWGKISANFRAKPRPTTAAAALVVVATNISSPIERAETQDAVAVALLLSAVSTVKQFVSSSFFSHSLASNHSRSKICLDFARGGALDLGTRKEPLKDMGGTNWNSWKRKETYLKDWLMASHLHSAATISTEKTCLFSRYFHAVYLLPVNVG